MSMRADGARQTGPRHAARDGRHSVILAFPRIERRRHPRGTPDGEPERWHLVSMVVGTYREMPGLTVNLGQAARLFGLRRTTCQIVLDDLVRGSQLRRTPDGQYIGI